MNHRLIQILHGQKGWRPTYAKRKTMSHLITDELALLRRFEPVLRFTRGEHFFPMDVAPYVAGCCLCVQRPEEPVQVLVPAGRLKVEDLAIPYPDEFGAVHYLKFVGSAQRQPATAKEAQTAANFRPQERFHAGLGRLARVGYGSRLIDALFSISLLARGRVPGATAAAAKQAYQSLIGEHERYIYYGRVVRQNGWLILQYWFFYSFNNWRSGFYGANDHEADWEMACLYLTEDEQRGAVQPVWVAYASHDYQGDDLRRHWDDPEVEKVNGHPVIYVGAGSHASYFSQGEYLTEIELAFLTPLARLAERWQRIWRERLRQYVAERADGQPSELAHIFRVPFVDYARGDGLTIGPSQAKAWETPCLLEPPPAWVTLYRGLWGLYTHDPFAGEDAPAGPMYNRDGSVRRAWYDPLGWAGLDKAAPPDEALVQTAAEERRLQESQAQLREQIEVKARDLQGLGVRVAAMQSQPHLYRLYTDQQQQMEQLAQEIDHLRRQLTAEQALSQAFQFYAKRLQTEQPGSLRSHIRRAHRPASAERLRISRLAEMWAAASVGLMLVLVVAVAYFARQYLFFSLAGVIAFYTLIEAGFRGRLSGLLTSVTIGLSALAALVIVYEFFWQIVVVGVLVAGGYMLWENLRELWG
jgi:hypothetical protein